MTSQLRMLVDNDLLLLGTVAYVNIQCNRSKPLFIVDWQRQTRIPPGKIQTQDQPDVFRNRQSFANCSVNLSIIPFYIDLDRIHNKLHSNYNLNTCFLRRFPFLVKSPFTKLTY